MNAAKTPSGDGSEADLERLSAAMRNAPPAMLEAPGDDAPDIGPMIEAVRETVRAFAVFAARASERDMLRAEELARAVSGLRAMLEVAEAHIAMIADDEAKP